MKPRKDFLTQKVIERGILLDHLRGSLAAWTYMASQKTPTEIITRVLCMPASRRQQDVLMISAWVDLGLEAKPPNN